MKVTITINNLDEQPNIPTLVQTVAAVNENTAKPAVATVSGSTDPEGEDVTYTLASGGDYFELEGGTLYVKEPLNFEALPESTATIDQLRVLAVENTRSTNWLTSIPRITEGSLLLRGNSGHGRSSGVRKSGGGQTVTISGWREY